MHYFFRKCIVYQKINQEMHLLLILCHCVQKCCGRSILFTLSSPIYDVSLVNSSRNLELSCIFLSSPHHLAFSGWPVLYFKWLSIYHTVIHLYWGSAKSNSCVYKKWICFLVSSNSQNVYWLEGQVFFVGWVVNCGLLYSLILDLAILIVTWLYCSRVSSFAQVLLCYE